jgi:phosphoribosylformylglycinamidine synthase
LAETFQPEHFGSASLLEQSSSPQLLLEIGPRQGLVTPWNSQAVAICQACGLTKVTRIERARRYSLFTPGEKLTLKEQQAVSKKLYDRMTEAVYATPLVSFESDLKAEPVKTIPLLKEGKAALVAYAKANDFAWSELMLNYICDYFIKQIRRDPTDVELFMFGQLNSEHCRHHKFNGKYVIDGQAQEQTLLQLIKSTFKGNAGPIAVAFSDNAAIMQPVTNIGFMPVNPLGPSVYANRPLQYCFVFKVETHNHPTAISPY